MALSPPAPAGLKAALALSALLLAQSLAAAPRVITLAPSLAEIMVELDSADLVVGVLDYGVRPPELAGRPSVGRHAQLELESLLSLKPDLVLLWPDSISRSQREQLDGLGIPLYVAEPHDLDQLARQFREIAVQLGRAEVGERLSERFTRGLADLRQRYAGREPVTVFYQVWHEPLFTLGGQQIVSDALRVCGARNVFADLSLPAPQVSVESVLARDPQVILGGSDAQLEPWQQWPTLQAVRKQQLWEVPDKGLERPSFQMLGALEKLCAVLHKAR